MIKQLFDKDVVVKDITCGFNGRPGHTCNDTRINVYTCLTHIVKSFLGSLI